MHANVSLIQNRNKTPHVDQFAISQRDMVLTQASTTRTQKLNIFDPKQK